MDIKQYGILPSHSASPMWKLNRCGKVVIAVSGLFGAGALAAIGALALLDVDSRSRDELGAAAGIFVGATVLFCGMAGWMFYTTQKEPANAET